MSLSEEQCLDLSLRQCVINSRGPECQLSLEMSLYNWTDLQMDGWMDHCFLSSPTCSVIVSSSAVTLI